MNLFNMPLSLQVSMVLGLLFFILFAYSALLSVYENEPRAAKVFTLFAFSIPIIYLLPSYFQGVIWEQIALVLDVLTISISALLFIPFSKKKPEIEMPKNKLDERDIMFSRNLLKPGTERFESYYMQHPDYKILDDKFREKAGLLSRDATFYHPYTFTSAEANFITVSALSQLVTAKPVPTKKEIDAQKIALYIKSWAKKLGAKSVGITSMKDYHFYSHKGRGERYGKPIENNHKNGIALTFEMDKEMLDAAPYGTAIMESAQQYLVAGTVAVQIATFIRELGYEATAHIDGKYEVVCPLVARDAGLGEIGRMGLLMTPELGPRVRISVVTTDLPLALDEVKPDYSMVEFCKYCKKCADVCPSRSISFDDREEINGIKRWQINSESCFTYWCTIGTDCGRCMGTCPYAHPNNFLHNFIRFGIKHFPLFRRVAVVLDDVFYGKKPKPKKFPKWAK